MFGKRTRLNLTILSVICLEQMFIYIQFMEEWWKTLSTCMWIDDHGKCNVHELRSATPLNTGLAYIPWNILFSFAKSHSIEHNLIVILSTGHKFFFLGIWRTEHNTQSLENSKSTN